MPEEIVIVECDRCHRPVASLGHPGLLIGTVHAENGGTTWVSSASPERRRWATRVLAADPDQGRGFLGRHKLVCVGRKHPREERPVTQDSLRRAYERAQLAGRTRIGMRGIR